jgi:hypothetical protein
LTSLLGTAGPDTTLLREISTRAGTGDLAPSLRSFRGSQARCDQVVATFLNHRILTHLLRQLTAASFDLNELSVAGAVWDRCSTSTVLPELPADADGRVSLGQIAKALETHRALQRRTLMLLAGSLPGSFMVMFGQGVALAHPGYSERFSHDIDLLVRRASDGQSVVDALADQGFVISDARSGSYRGVPFNDWTLDAPDLDGHKMHIDISTGAITRSDSWMRPLVLRDLFEDAYAVTLAHPATQTVLVPNDSHQLLMLAEKTQRTHRYDGRVRCDVMVLVRDGIIDVDSVSETARRTGLMNSLRWMLGDHRSIVRDRRAIRDVVSSQLIAAMAHGTHRPRSRNNGWQHHPSRLHGIAAQAFRRLEA